LPPPLRARLFCARPDRKCPQSAQQGARSRGANAARVPTRGRHTGARSRGRADTVLHPRRRGMSPGARVRVTRPSPRPHSRDQRTRSARHRGARRRAGHPGESYPSRALHRVPEATDGTTVTLRAIGSPRPSSVVAWVRYARQGAHRGEHRRATAGLRVRLSNGVSGVDDARAWPFKTNPPLSKRSYKNRKCFQSASFKIHFETGIPKCSYQNEPQSALIKTKRGFKVLLSKRDPPFKIYFQNTNPCRHPCRPCA
jgi:hypothetical protein